MPVQGLCQSIPKPSLHTPSSHGLAAEQAYTDQARQSCCVVRVKTACRQADAHNWLSAQANPRGNAIHCASIWKFGWREVRYLCPSTRCSESREARTAIRTSETGTIRGSVAHRTLMEKKLVQQLIFIQIHIFPAPIYLATYCAADDPFAADASKIFPRLWRKKMPMRRVL